MSTSVGRVTRVLRDAGVLLVGAVLLLVLLELIAFAVNWALDCPQPVLLRQKDGRPGPEAYFLDWQASALDPNLGHAYGEDVLSRTGRPHLPGFLLYGETAAEPDLTIVTLGGSTTDTVFLPHNWPAQLSDLLTAAGYRARVYNGGMAAYASSQELMKLARDGLSLKPDLVISYSGVNEGVTVVREHPFVHNSQDALARYILERGQATLLPNIVALFRRLRPSSGIKEVSRGVVDRDAIGPRWARRVRGMAALTESSGGRFVAYLQPALGFGRYEATDEERAWCRERHSCVPRQDYEDLQRAAQGLPWATDLTDVFAGRGGLYTDHVHLTEAGNAAVAGAIFADLQRRGLLSRDR